MHITELAHVLDELRACVGQHRGQIWQPARDQLVVEVGSSKILIITGSGRARVHLSTSRPRQPQKPFSFQGACRARLGPTLTAVTLLEPNRAFELSFGRSTLYFQLFGRGLGLLMEGGLPVVGMDGPAPEELPSLGDPPGPPRPPRFTPREGESWNQAAEYFFRARQAEMDRKDLLARCRKRLSQEIKRLVRLVAGLERDLDASAQAPVLRGKADTLAANLHRVTRGAPSIRLPSLENPEEEVEIVLDPRKSPSENLNRLYNKARRLDRAADQVLERLDTQEQALATHRETLSALESLTLTELRDLEKSLPKQQRAPRVVDVRSDWDLWHGPAGMRLRVGRNERANRALCFSSSRGRDWWLHLRDRPGAHVVLSLAGTESPPLDALLAGAELVLTAARIPEGTAADVQYTQIRHLRPIPGETGGRVRVAKEKVLRAIREPANLQLWVREPRNQG